MLKQVTIGFCLMFFSNISASHIVGGEMTYSYKGNHKYDVKLLLYIDCYNGSSSAIASDKNATIVVFDGSTNQVISNLCQSVTRNNPVRVSKSNYSCIKITPNACVDAYEYNYSFTLPPIVGGYYLSFQRCCRNSTINNINNPSTIGENIWTYINDTAKIGFNSSPIFNTLPPNFLCTNTPLEIDLSATDSDGDSLVYEFFNPYNGTNTSNCTGAQLPPFTLVNYASGYTVSNPVPSSPNLLLDKKTGKLNITPTLTGQFVIGILVKEFRKGKYIGATRRDYQFNIQDCVFETIAAYTTPNVNCNREVFLTNTSINANAYKWDFGDSSTLSDTSNSNQGYYKYPKPGTYKVKLIAYKNNCYSVFEKWITILDRIQFKLPKDIYYCGFNQTTIKPDTFYKGAQYLWDNGSTDSFLMVNTYGTYWLKITLGNCNSYDSIVLAEDSLMVDMYSDSLRCNLDNNQLTGVLWINEKIKTIDWFHLPEVDPFKQSDTFALINQKGWYTIKGIKSNNCPFTDSLYVEDWQAKQWLKSVNVFTPNGDLKNDVFPELKPPYHYHLQIFDRWGVEVYKAYDQPWDGGNFPDGSYYFFIDMEACGQKAQAHGVLRIIH